MVLVLAKRATHRDLAGGIADGTNWPLCNGNSLVFFGQVFAQIMKSGSTGKHFFKWRKATYYMYSHL